MWKAEALVLCAAAEEERAHGGGLADADGCDGRGDVCHCVIDCEACVRGKSSVNLGSLYGLFMLEAVQLDDPWRA